MATTFGNKGQSSQIKDPEKPIQQSLAEIVEDILQAHILGTHQIQSLIVEVETETKGVYSINQDTPYHKMVVGQTLVIRIKRK